MTKKNLEDARDERETSETNAEGLTQYNARKIPSTKFSWLDAAILTLANTKHQKGSVALSLAGIILATSFLSYLLVSSFVLSEIGLEGVQDYFWWVLLASLAICFVGINYTTYSMASRRSFELGTFRALGGRWQHVLKILLLDSVLIGFIGGIFGVIIGVTAGFYVLADEHGVNVVGNILLDSKGEGFLLETLMISLGISMLFTTASTVYPFLTITLRSPADAIRSEF
ncbi:MAG: FtsX-like permease family protein [Candidatus Hodarchaeales archaeon]